MMENPKSTMEFHGFQKLQFSKKNVMSQMNTDGIRGFWLYALASLHIVHRIQEGKFSAQYRVPNNKMELSFHYLFV